VHSRPQSAVLSYGTALLMRPVALALDRAHVPTILWYVHFLACFIGLAYLPFSRMFHIFATPVSLMANAVMEKNTSAPANIATASYGARCLYSLWHMHCALLSRRGLRDNS